ncbi:MAG: hypothetical protein WAN50_01655 [Minisyncoccia bacterium]
MKICIAAAAAILIILCALLVRESDRLSQLNYANARASLLARIHAHGPATANDANRIASWMTFDYINHLFNLPPIYLQTALAITDHEYPRLTIAACAKSEGRAQAAFLKQVQDAVRAYAAKAQ